MNHKYPLGGFVLLAVVFILWLSPVFGEISNRVVAIVNNEVITLHELQKRFKELTGIEPEAMRSQDQDRYLATRRKILELMIDEMISQEKIKELGIKVTDKQIDATIEKIKSDNQITHEDIMGRLKTLGLTYEKYRESIKKDLERANLINFEVNSKIIIREEEIARYYEKHKEQFGGEVKVHLASIFLLKKDKENAEEMRELHNKGEQILARLRKGEDFAKLVRQFSEGPGVDEGGDLGIFNISQLEPELKKVLEEIPEGGISDLIVRPNGIQIIKLIKKQGGKEKGLNEMHNAIYDILFREEVNRKFSSWLKELRERSYTKIIF